MGTLFLQPCERDGVEETNSEVKIGSPSLSIMFSCSKVQIFGTRIS